MIERGLSRSVAATRRLFRLHPGWYALLAASLLTIVGVAAIGTVAPRSAGTQGQRWVPVALAAMLLCFFPSPRVVGSLAYALFGGTLLLLVFLMVGPESVVPVRNGARSWIQTPVMNVQPSELTKITFVLCLAWYLRYRDTYRTLKGFVLPFVFMCVPVALILKQPDLGTALIFPPALVAMLVAAGAKMRHLIGVLASVAVVGTVVVGVIALDPPDPAPKAVDLPDWAHVLAPHQEERIAALIWPDEYPRTAAFQQQAAKTLIGAGGWMGHGRERSALLVRAAGLPEPHNDMIYAVIVNRWGVLGGLMTVALYGVLVGAILLTASRTKDPFARLVCVGFAGMLLAQTAVNIAMNIGLMPITGITLPFISYGGSSLLTTYMMVGLILNFATRKPMRLGRPSFEYGRSDAVLS